MGETKYSHAEIVLSNFLRFESTPDGLRYYFPKSIIATNDNRGQKRVYESLNEYDDIIVLRKREYPFYPLAFEEHEELSKAVFVLKNRYTALKLYIFSLGFHAFSYPDYFELASLIKNEKIKKVATFLFPESENYKFDHKVRTDRLIGDYCSKLAVNAVNYALFGEGEYVPLDNEVTPEGIKNFGFVEVNAVIDLPILEEDIPLNCEKIII